MALKVNNDSNVSAYILVNESSSGTTPNVNVTGTSGKIHSMDVSNGAATHTSFLKMKLTEGTVTAGTTEPDVMLTCGPSTSERYDFPTGLDFSQLSFWTTRLAATTDTTTPNTTIVTILASK